MKSGFPTRILLTAFAAFAIGQSTPLSAVVLPAQQGAGTETKSGQAISDEDPFLESGAPAAAQEPQNVQPQNVQPQNVQPQNVQPQQEPEEKLIRFQYNSMPWNRVIEDFTEQTGLALQPFSEYPEGCLLYTSPSPRDS